MLIGNRRSLGGLLAFYILFALAESSNLVSNQERVSYPQVIGHAGASGYLPESTLEVILDSRLTILRVVRAMI